MDFVFRGNQDSPEDASIDVVLGCGFTVSFFEIGFTDEEYVKRAKKIKELENQ